MNSAHSTFGKIHNPCNSQRTILINPLLWFIPYLEYKNWPAFFTFPLGAVYMNSVFHSIWWNMAWKKRAWLWVLSSCLISKKWLIPCGFSCLLNLIYECYTWISLECIYFEAGPISLQFLSNIHWVTISIVTQILTNFTNRLFNFIFQLEIGYIFWRAFEYDLNLHTVYLFKAI